MNTQLHNIEPNAFNKIKRSNFLQSKAENLTMAPDADACYQILVTYDLQSIMPYIDRFNPSANAPYHGAFHEAALVSLVYEGAIFHKLSYLDVRTLCAAAALHDFNHSAGAAHNDEQNINAAINGLHLIAQATNKPDNIILSKSEIEQISNIIKSTQYPYVEKELSILDKIIRDADLMMPLLPTNDALSLFQGLLCEMQIQKPHLTIEEFVPALHTFYDNVKWNTSWAMEKTKNNIWKQHLDDLVSALQNTIQNSPQQLNKAKP